MKSGSVIAPIHISLKSLIWGLTKPFIPHGTSFLALSQDLGAWLCQLAFYKVLNRLVRLLL